MPMSPEEKRTRKVQRTLERFKCLRLFKAVNETARLFQKLVRLKAIETDGRLTCCSCGKRDFPGKHFDAGHWIGRTSKATIFDARNCHPQCVACNRFGVGPVKAGYDQFMRKKYGEKTMEELVRLGNTTRQWTRHELAEKYVSYQEELRTLEK